MTDPYLNGLLYENPMSRATASTLLVGAQNLLTALAGVDLPGQSGRDAVQLAVTDAYLQVAANLDDPIGDDVRTSLVAAVQRAFTESDAAAEGQATQADARAQVTGDLEQAAKDLPATIGNAAGAVAAGAAGAAGTGLSAGLVAFAKGLFTNPIGILFLAAVGLIVYKKYVKK